MESFLAFMAILALGLMLFIPGMVYLCTRAHSEAVMRNQARLEKLRRRFPTVHSWK